MRGKGSPKVYRAIITLFTIYILDSNVETEMDLLFRNLSAWVIIQNQSRYCSQYKRR